MSGRGRGKSSVAALATALHIDRREMRSASVSGGAQSLFPARELKLLPLVEDHDVFSKADYEYLVTLKESFVTASREGPFYFECVQREKDVERYTDRLSRRSNAQYWQPDLKRTPRELWPLAHKRSLEQTKRVKLDSLNARLAALEKAEQAPPKEKHSESETEEEEDKPIVDEDREEDEEDDEEYNDYAQAYFDGGENYIDDSEDNPDDDATF